MKHLFRIVLSAAVVAAMTLACKKDLPEKKKEEKPNQETPEKPKPNPEDPEKPTPKPEPKKDTTFVLEATVAGEAKYDGSGDLKYTVKSIRKIDNKEEFFPWTMEFSTDGGQNWTANKPEYLTLTVKEDNGDVTAKSYTAKFTAQEKTIVNNSVDILKARDVKTNVDLSMVDVKGNAHGKGTTTANCYVIHNPGTYKFPTVYGNSRKNGADNPASYTSSKTSTNILKKFIKADGNPITQPQIENINNACLIWQDTKDLISNISYNANYVSFEVKKETIHNGNAIIAVRDASNTILWSWHIWVTEEDLTPVEITNHNNINYSILPVNLGWCGLGTATDYAPREVKIRIKQTEGNKSIELALNQTPHFEGDRKNGNCTFYQWGRKDPMLPGNGLGNVDKECFTTEDKYQFAYNGNGEPLNTSDIKEYIKYPYRFNINYYMDNQYYNLWNVDNEKTDKNDDKVVKSVYDPCPVGYSVPAVRTFTGFTTTGGITTTSSEFNVNGGWNKGWLFYGKSGKSGSAVFFPAAGSRSYDAGSLNSVPTYGFYLVAGPYNTNHGRSLYFGSSRVEPLDYGNRTYGFPVRPAQEQ